MTLIPQSRPLTRVDLERLPDDGHRYELLDGALLVTPAPSPRHQVVVAALLVRLTACATEGLRVLAAPLDVVLADDAVLQPDVLVAPAVAFGPLGLLGPPALAVEVLSPSTRLLDLGTKKARWAEAGTPAYCVVDPEVPSITAWRRDADGYVEVGSAVGPQPLVLDQPFRCTLVPDDLVR